MNLYLIFFFKYASDEKADDEFTAHFENVSALSLIVSGAGSLQGSTVDELLTPWVQVLAKFRASRGKASLACLKKLAEQFQKCDQARATACTVLCRRFEVSFWETASHTYTTQPCFGLRDELSLPNLSKFCLSAEQNGMVYLFQSIDAVQSDDVTDPQQTTIKTYFGLDDVPTLAFNLKAALMDSFCGALAVYFRKYLNYGMLLVASGRWLNLIPGYPKLRTYNDFVFELLIGSWMLLGITSGNEWYLNGRAWGHKLTFSALESIIFRFTISQWGWWVGW